MQIAFFFQNKVMLDWLRLVESGCPVGQKMVTVPGCLWSAQLNLDWRRSHALGSEDASHWGQKNVTKQITWCHAEKLKKVTSELQVLQRFSDFACQGGFAVQKGFRRNSSRDPCSRCKALCLEQALKRILPLGARNGWTIAVPLSSTEKRSTFPGAKHPRNQPNPQIQAAEIIPCLLFLSFPHILQRPFRV